jgi:hypothetical protein
VARAGITLIWPGVGGWPRLLVSRADRSSISMRGKNDFQAQIFSKNKVLNLQANINKHQK